MDLTSHTLWRDDVRVPLTNKAFEILRVLVERAGHVVTKDALLGAVWPDTYVHPDNVKVLIGEIRRAIGDDPTQPRFIRSIVKRGYIFIAPVSESADLAAPQHLPSFVGRDSEIELLIDALDEAARSNRQVLFVSGEAGIGKTSLCEAFLRLAGGRHTVRTTWAQCNRTTGPSEPYHPLIELLARLVRAADDDSISTTLARHAPGWVPHLPGHAGEAWRVVAAGGQMASASRMLREIVSALEALADASPLVLWIEDVHWADPATIDVLTALGQRTDPAKLLILASTRPPDAVPSAGALRRAYADLIEHGRARAIRLQPFVLEEVERYVEARFGDVGDDQIGPILYRATGGNPLFLASSADHLVRKGYLTSDRNVWRREGSDEALEATIPGSFAAAVAREFDELATDERLAIASASVLGLEFSLWLAAQASSVDELALEPVLETLARRQRFIVREGVVELANGMFSPMYRFRHSLYQEIVYDRTDHQARSQAHERAGLATERLFVGRESDVAGDLAWHFHRAGDHSRAARYFRLAAANALKRYAPREAAALLHGALTHAAHLTFDERRRIELPLMLELGQAQLAAGEATLAVETLSRLERRADEENRHNDRLRALLILLEAHAGTSHSTEMELARTITAIVPHATDETLAAGALVRAGLAELVHDGWSDDTADRCVETWRTLPRTAVDEHRSLAIRLLLVQTIRSQYAAAWTAGRKLLPAVIRGGNLSDCLVGCYLLAIAALHLGRWGDALEVAGEGAAIAERTGATRSSMSMRLLEAWIALEGQRWEDARRLSLADRSLGEGPGCKVPLQMSLLFGGAAALGMGDLGAAEADLERLRAWYAAERTALDWLWKPQLHAYLAQLAIRQGDLDRAWAESLAAQHAANRTPERTWRARVLVVGAQVATERGGFEEAERLLRQARRETRGIEAPLASWQIEAVMATLLDKTSQPDSARRARTRYERTFHRLARSLHEHQLEPLSQAAGRFH